MASLPPEKVFEAGLYSARLWMIHIPLNCEESV